jgi:NADPH-dependent 2,4-dienoyl-CoA reductase/sulfur reductase-like enzyme
VTVVLQWRTNEFYSKLGVEVCVNTTVVSFDAVGKRLTMRAANDDATTTLAFNYALLATGGTPRSLPCAGFGLKRVYQLRTPVDANAINAAVTSSTRVVIIGSSFIGMEAASALAKKVCR